MSERLYEIRIPGGEIKRVYGTLEDATTEALYWVESFGWIHERQYAAQPLGGVAWACPGGTQAIVVTPA